MATMTTSDDEVAVISSDIGVSCKKNFIPSKANVTVSDEEVADSRCDDLVQFNNDVISCDDDDTSASDDEEAELMSNELVSCNDELV